MLPAIIYLLAFCLAGELLALGLGLPVPGNVLGMLLLFVFLILRRGVPASLDSFVPKLLAPLALYFMPSAVGVVTLGPLLAQEGWGIVLTMVVSTIVPLWLLGFWLDRWLCRRARSAAGSLPQMAEDGHVE